MSELSKSGSNLLPPPVLLADYQPPQWLVDTVELRIELDPIATRVECTMQVRRNPALAESSAALQLDGDELQLISVAVDGDPMTPQDYELQPTLLSIPLVGDEAEVRLVTEINPAANTALEGLYRSGDMFCTQCEAEGFRRITWFPDRPDVLSCYRVTLVADAQMNPILLGNGNLTDSGELEDGRHWALWDDPFPKPSYLFALVAGNLESVRKNFMTMSGRSVELIVWAARGDTERCHYALECMRAAMVWDERAYGREYDLDSYQIVAVHDFNMGAMENKGLNIFNAQYVLASPETATDDDYASIEAIIGHEYFHNWSGNRVTCRDWFQLSLKEGFTVFREQQFVAAQAAARATGGGADAVVRIADLRRLRTMQFPEDAGPTAHPVRPERYREINNLYTATVYEKGAELVRMLHGLLGVERFRAGCDLYFERHDGEAVTVEDFLAALADASGENLDSFKRWYAQAGTPRVVVEEDFNTDSGRYRLTFSQSCPPTPGQPDKEVVPIPVAMRLLGSQDAEEQIVRLETTSTTLEFDGFEQRPVPSLLRRASAPVELIFEQSPEQLLDLLRDDDDGYVRWDASQRLFLLELKHLQDDPQLTVSADFIAAKIALLEREDDAADLTAELMAAPDLRWLLEQPELRLEGQLDLDRLLAAWEQLRYALALFLAEKWKEVRSLPGDEPGRRRLRNQALFELTLNSCGVAYMRNAAETCREQYESADNMTDTLGALRASLNLMGEQKEASHLLFDRFADRWADDPLVMTKWFALQSTNLTPNSVETVAKLGSHPLFRPDNPNFVRALYGGFAHMNPVGFHRADGAGYALIAEQVRRLDKINPQVAARLASCFSRWRLLDADRQEKIQLELNTLIHVAGLSRNVADIIGKSLQN